MLSMLIYKRQNSSSEVPFCAQQLMCNQSKHTRNSLCMSPANMIKDSKNTHSFPKAKNFSKIIRNLVITFLCILAFQLPLKAKCNRKHVFQQIDTGILQAPGRIINGIQVVNNGTIAYILITENSIHKINMYNIVSNAFVGPIFSLDASSAGYNIKMQQITIIDDFIIAYSDKQKKYFNVFNRVTHSYVSTNILAYGSTAATKMLYSKAQDLIAVLFTNGFFYIKDKTQFFATTGYNKYQYVSSGVFDIAQSTDGAFISVIQLNSVLNTYKFSQSFTHKSSGRQYQAEQTQYLVWSTVEDRVYKDMCTNEGVYSELFNQNVYLGRQIYSQNFYDKSRQQNLGRMGFMANDGIYGNSLVVFTKTKGSLLTELNVNIYDLESLTLQKKSLQYNGHTINGFGIQSESSILTVWTEQKVFAYKINSQIPSNTVENQSLLNNQSQIISQNSSVIENVATEEISEIINEIVSDNTSEIQNGTNLENPENEGEITDESSQIQNNTLNDATIISNDTVDDNTSIDTNQNSNSSNQTKQKSKTFQLSYEGKFTNQFQQYKQFLGNTISSKLVSVSNTVPGSRRIVRVLFGFFANFDDFWLYSYHSRQYNVVLNHLFLAIQQLQQDKWELFRAEYYMDYLGISTSAIQNFFCLKKSYTSKRFLKMEQGKSNGLLANTINFVFSNLPMTILMFCVLKILFHLLFKFKVSVFIRSYSFLAYLFLLIFEGNIIFFFYLFTFDIYTLFSLKFADKIVYFAIHASMFTLLFFIVYFFVLVKEKYRSRNKYFLDNISKTMSLDSIIYNTLNFGLKNTIFGIIHYVSEHEYFYKMNGLLFMEILFLVINIYFINKDILNSRGISQKVKRTNVKKSQNTLHYPESQQNLQMNIKIKLVYQNSTKVYKNSTKKRTFFAQKPEDIQNTRNEDILQKNQQRQVKSVRNLFESKILIFLTGILCGFLRIIFNLTLQLDYNLLLSENGQYIANPASHGFEDLFIIIHIVIVNSYMSIYVICVAYGLYRLSKQILQMIAQTCKKKNNQDRKQEQNIQHMSVEQNLNAEEHIYAEKKIFQKMIEFFDNIKQEQVKKQNQKNGYSSETNENLNKDTTQKNRLNGIASQNKDKKKLRTQLKLIHTPNAQSKYFTHQFQSSTFEKGAFNKHKQVKQRTSTNKITFVEQKMATARIKQMQSLCNQIEQL